jgi:sulfoxide reductase heme-binding subunit YedZ
VSLPLAAAPSPLWYLTRGSGLVALLLLTGSILLGIGSSLGWRGPALPRFLVAGLHRNLTLLAVIFVAIHVATTVADSFTPIGIKDAFIPFLSSYRPFWLGLGALASDLVLALVLTSLLRVRIGYRAWRLTHWLAYAAWPLALVHALGTGSDARFGWMAAIALGSIAVVVAAIVLRAGKGGWGPAALAAVGTSGACALAIGLWYDSGPAQRGWAARAGTPSAILAAPRAALPRVAAPAGLKSLPRTFAAALSGRIEQSPVDQNGLITVDIALRLQGAVRGQLRLALRGAPTDGGGVSMTSSGVAFEGSGPTAVYQGSIVALDGTNVVADLSAPSGGTLRLAIALRIDPGSGAVSGSLRGALL